MRRQGEQQEQEFLALINQHRGIIYKVARLYQKDEEEGEDLVQEILLQLWRAYPSFQQKAQFSTWMYRIALNTAISSIRKKKRRPVAESIDTLENLHEQEASQLEREERSDLLWKAIGRLSPVEKAIVVLYLEEYKYEEMAEMVGISVNYIGVKLNRIKQKLKGMLSPHLT